MPTIKGPIKLRAGHGIPDVIKEAVGEVKLPFSASNFTFSNESLNGKKFRFANGDQIIAKSGGLKAPSILDRILG